MKKLSLLVCLFSALNSHSNCADGKSNYTLAFHGGIGETSYSAQLQLQRKDFVKRSLEEGREQLATGGSALDAVEGMIKKMEDSGLFNAGKGAVANEKKLIRLDASIMNGEDLSGGGVADFSRVKNPISAAREAMKKGNRLFVSSDGEESVLKGSQLETAPASYFVPSVASVVNNKPKDWGTIGALAMDKCGNLAAGTSTGGYLEKPAGRVGDSPIIGAGTYAQNGVCAVSATGQGEKFIRISAAHEVCAQIRLAGKGAQKAADDVIQKQIKTKLQGVGAIIALDKKGRFVYSSTHPEAGTLRGFVSDNKIQVAVFDQYEVAKIGTPRKVSGKEN